jgi:adenylate cyclase class IV
VIGRAAVEEIAALFASLAQPRKPRLPAFTSGRPATRPRRRLATTPNGELTNVARNIEIKARIPALEAIRTKALSLASSPGEVLHQTDTFFTVPKGRLKVREFPGGSGELIAYRRPNHPGPKESVYSRCVCQSAKMLADTLSDVLPVRGAVAKRRELFLVGSTRIHLDEVEGLGAFVELEVVLSDGESVERGERVARELLRDLEIPESSLISEAYIDLLEALPSHT